MNDPYDIKKESKNVYLIYSYTILILIYFLYIRCIKLSSIFMPYEER